MTEASRPIRSFVLAALGAMVLVPAGVVGVALALIALWPSSAPSRLMTVIPVIAQAVAFPVALGILLVPVVIIFAGVAPVLGPGWRLATFAMAGVYAVSAVALVLPTVIQGDSARAVDPGETLTVVSWNTANRLTKEKLASLVEQFDPDVLVLPETGRRTLKKVLDTASDHRTEMAHFTTAWTGENTPTSVLVHARLGPYRMVEGITTTSGAITLEPIDDDSLPMIVGLHSAPPTPGLMANWRRDLEAAAGAAGCSSRGGRDTIVAGDFNATLRHGALALRTGCTDAMESVGNQHVGTWPTDIPAWLGTSIDHILVGGGLQVVSGEVVTMGGSDHRVVVATIRLG